MANRRIGDRRHAPLSKASIISSTREPSLKHQSNRERRCERLEPYLPTRPVPLMRVSSISSIAVVSLAAASYARW